jgi:hypothetical protein
LKLGVTKYARDRHLGAVPTFGGTKLFQNQLDEIVKLAEQKPSQEGLPDWLKIIRIEADELTSLPLCPIATVTADNVAEVQSAMEARREGEPEFREFWLPRSAVTEQTVPATHISAICYSAEQLAKEAAEAAEDQPTDDFDVDVEDATHGLVTANAEAGDSAPMMPNTIARNEMGPAAGGNGETYPDDVKAASRLFWVTKDDTPETMIGKHVMVRDG